MQPEVAERLGHVVESIDAIDAFVADITLEQYLASRMHRRAVEREFEIIGEALNIAARLDPTLTDHIAALRSIIGLRNRVIHGYETVDDTVLWATAHTNLPELRQQVLALLG